MTYILYPVWFNAVQTQKERIKFYIRTLKHDKRGSSQFSPFKNKFPAQDITDAVKKKKKKFFICEHWYEKLSGRILFTMYGRGEGSDFFKALFIIPYYLITC